MSELDKAIGALVGLAVGDAVGTTLEFRSPGSFEPLTDMVGGGPFRLAPGEWTDDTSMALCLAESILDTGAMHLEDQLRRYVMWKNDGYLSSNGRCFDIGHTTRSQLERYQRSGEAIDPHPDEESAANGSLMRLAAVPIRWHADPALAAQRSAESSRSTHPAQRPVDSCRLLGAIVSALITGASLDTVTAGTFWKWGTLHPGVADIAAGGWKQKQPPQIRGSGYCISALEAALWAVGGAQDFASAILRAANLGDDADTTAAIAGQIAGAHWGASAIPSAWRDKLVSYDRITPLALGLYRAGGGTMGETAWPYDDFLHAWWVERGRLLAGEYPGHREPSRARQKLDLLVDAGVRTWVDLTTPADRLDPYEPFIRAVAGARRLDLQHVPFPVPDLGVVDDDQFDRVLATISDSQSRGGVYLHCWGGVGRTATVVGCVLADRGFDYHQVMDQLATLRSGTRKANRRAPETPIQNDVIKRRVAKRRLGP